MALPNIENVELSLDGRNHTLQEDTTRLLLTRIAINSVDPGTPLSGDRGQEIPKPKPSEGAAPKRYMTAGTG
ncbi:hypothetical protein NDU88_002505 [Pleurodeles waltl]|uniref:Uncharacterized protein n=1 Tax=Pleurodeles waltl TaxID=8319 RepID=A0AAV7LFS0_PLEWA|nr:hypothetical protein NDU88_002505 [Pleurodeles waltl]